MAEAGMGAPTYTIDTYGGIYSITREPVARGMWRRKTKRKTRRL